MNQLSIIDGISKRDEGISRVTSNAGNFVRVMREIAKFMSLRDGSVSTDELRVYADKHGLMPHHQNAWGGVFRGKGWKVIGRKQSAWPGNHAREIREWRWENDSDSAST